jgi:hypothetical protein
MWQELLVGPNGGSAFASEHDREATWRQYVADLMEGWPKGAVLWGEKVYGAPTAKGWKRPTGQYLGFEPVEQSRAAANRQEPSTLNSTPDGGEC